MTFTALGSPIAKAHPRAPGAVQPLGVPTAYSSQQCFVTQIQRLVETSLTHQRVQVACEGVRNLGGGRNTQLFCLARLQIEEAAAVAAAEYLGEREGGAIYHGSCDRLGPRVSERPQAVDRIGTRSARMICDDQRMFV